MAGGRIGRIGVLPRGLRALAGPREPVASDWELAAENGGSAGLRGPPSRAGADEAPLERAREKVAVLLEDVERLRPGLVRHRSLDMECRSGVLAQALCESFDSCDAVGASAATVSAAQHVNRHGERCRYRNAERDLELPFADETFDLVYCGTLPRDQERREELIIAEAVRVLRLQGLAVVDSPADEQLLRTRPTARDGPERLPVHLSTLSGLRLMAGELGELPVTVSNAGGSVLGSPINPLRLTARWKEGREDGREAATALLPGILEPADSTIVLLRVEIPSTPGTHLLELSLASPGPWGDRRSPATELAIDVVPSAQRAQRIAAAAPTADDRVSRAVARAGGLLLGARIIRPPGDERPLRRHFFGRA
jgi:SAM-dependent methyltransferase